MIVVARASRQTQFLKLMSFPFKSDFTAIMPLVATAASPKDRCFSGNQREEGPNMLCGFYLTVRSSECRRRAQNAALNLCQPNSGLPPWRTGGVNPTPPATEPQRRHRSSERGPRRQPVSPDGHTGACQPDGRHPDAQFLPDGDRN